MNARELQILPRRLSDKAFSCRVQVLCHWVGFPAAVALYLVVTARGEHLGCCPRADSFVFCSKNVFWDPSFAEFAHSATLICLSPALYMVKPICGYLLEQRGSHP